MNQSLKRRLPQQQRAQHKIGLMFEATMRLIERDGLAALTTNAVAATAGVSIGTLYQYFSNKQALLDALVELELGAMSEKIAASFEGERPAAHGDRIRLIFRAVTGAYGGRTRVRRVLMEHALAQGGGTRMNP